MRPELGDKPIEAEYVVQMNGVATFLDKIFNGDVEGKARRVGFILLVFEYGEQEGRCNYISNGADRDDVLKFLEEQAKRFRDDKK